MQETLENLMESKLDQMIPCLTSQILIHPIYWHLPVQDTPLTPNSSL